MIKDGRRRRRRGDKPKPRRKPVATEERAEPPRQLSLRRGLALLVSMALAAAAVGVAIVLHVRGWSALGSESGGRCGGRLGVPCPQGLTGVLLLAFGFTFAGLFLLVFLSNVFSNRLDPLRPGRASPFGAMSSRRWSAIVAVVGLLVGIWPGVLLYNGLRGQFLEVRWSAPLDRPSGVTGVGNWSHDDLVVRARVDRLTAYTDTGTAWTMEIPGRDALCTMSRNVEDGVGLVAWAADNQPCATVAAIDLRTGKSLWQLTRSAADRYGAEMTSDQLAVAEGVAVFTEPTGLRAVGLRENDERWRLDAGEGCTPTSVAADADHVTMLVDCGDAGLSVAAVEPATGRERWRTALPVEPPLTTAVLLAAHPVVVHAVEEGSRAADDIISFGDEGQVRARIPRSGPDYDMPPADEANWPARVARPLLVRNDRLIAPIAPPGGDEYLAMAAFSLETGERLWLTVVDGAVAAIDLTTDGLVVATRSLRLEELSAADGTVTSSVPVRGSWYASMIEVQKMNDAYAIIERDGTAYPPVVIVG